MSLSVKQKRERNRCYIVKNTPLPALYDGLAEECIELASAALKMSRIFRKESPTPADVTYVKDNINEEFGDVLNLASTLGLEIDRTTMDRKMQRWYDRLKEKEKKDNDGICGD